MAIESEVAPVLAKMVYGVGYISSLFDSALHLGLDHTLDSAMAPHLRELIGEARYAQHDDDAVHTLRVRFIQTCYPELVFDVAPTAAQIDGILKAYAP